MNQVELIKLAEDLNRWLDEMSIKYNLSKSDIQAVLKQLLFGCV